MSKVPAALLRRRGQRAMPTPVASDSIEAFLDEAMQSSIVWRDIGAPPRRMPDSAPLPPLLHEDDDDDDDTTLSGAPAARPRVDALLDDGLRALLGRDFTNARQIFRAILTIEPQNRLAQVNLARLEALGA